MEISGSYPLAALERLAPLLHQAEGEVAFRLHFSKDREGRRLVTGQVAARLVLVCQRCLAPTWFPVEREVLLGIVANLAAADQLPAELDPLVVADTLSIREMVEDELILELPVVAMHEIDQCPAREVLEQYVPGEEEGSNGLARPNPFAVLKSLNPV
ncbi:23S rRNA accumulation protein YceD [Gammaproteobacteria bacterium]